MVCVGEVLGKKKRDVLGKKMIKMLSDLYSERGRR
jgi:hypothetical protein